MRLMCIAVRPERVLVVGGLLFVVACGGNSPFATQGGSANTPTEPVSPAARNGDRIQAAVPGASVKQPTHPLTPELKAKMDAMMSDPRWINRIAKLRRITDRGMIAYAIVDRPLPMGVRAIVRLGQPGSLPRYAVVSREGFDDQVILLAQVSALSYEMLHEDDDTPVQITAYTDGHIEATSGKYGGVPVAPTSHGHVEDLGRHSRQMLQTLAVAPAADIPGFGAARIVRIPDAHLDTAR